MSKIITANKMIERDLEKLLTKADIIISNTLTKVNYEIIIMYFGIGEMITEYKKVNNSKYGDFVIKRFSEELTLRYGKGFSKSNIKYSIKFYNYFSDYIQSINEQSSKLKFPTSGKSHEQKNLPTYEQKTNRISCLLENLKIS